MGYITYLEPRFLILKIENSVNFQTIETVAPMLDKLIEQFYGSSVWLLNDFRELRINLPKRVREYILRTLAPHLEASAFLVGTSFSKILVNIILNFSKSKHPRKLFNDQEMALAWLRKLKENKF
ncbi:MAG: hypothetical protein MK212_01750 [Saprospiraceae bacterium]|nr:hypothetical protein [Saprospiraceae bacterium]